MSVFDWVVLCVASAAAFYLVIFRRRPPTAKEIAKEVVIATVAAELARSASATVPCTRCLREVPPWFVEDYSTEHHRERICLKCSQDMPYPPAGQNEDEYVENWRAERDLRRQEEEAEREHVDRERS